MDKKGGNRIFVLFIFLAMACFFDYRKDRIPNALVIAGMLAAIARKVLFHCFLWEMPGGGQALATEIGSCILWMGIFFLVLYPLFKLGMLGAGDVKLYCMSAAFLPGKDCVAFFTCSMVIAAMLSLGKLLCQKNIKERLYYFSSYLTDVVRYGSFKVYLAEADVHTKKRASLHMAGPMLVGLILHLCGMYWRGRGGLV